MLKVHVVDVNPSPP